MKQTVLATVALIGFALPAFAFANDGSPQAATTATAPASVTSGLAPDASPLSPLTNRR